MTNKLFASKKGPLTFRTTVDNTCEVFQALHFPWIEIHFDFQVTQNSQSLFVFTVLLLNTENYCDVSLSLLIYFGFPQLQLSQSDRTKRRRKADCSFEAFEETKQKSPMLESEPRFFIFESNCAISHYLLEISIKRNDLYQLPQPPKRLQIHLCFVIMTFQIF